MISLDVISQVFVDLDKFDHRDGIGTSGSVHLNG
jgi:hypothetical protein